MAHVTVPEDSNNGRKVTVVGGTPQDVFPFTFPFFSDADIRAYVDGEETEDFTVAGTGSAVDGGYTSGEVTLDTAVSNVTVIIERDVALSRTEDFPYPSNTVNIKALNTALDRFIAIFQQFRRVLVRSLRQPVADTADIDYLPVKADRAGKVLAFDADGDPVASTLTLSALEAQPTNAAASAAAAAASAAAAATSETNAGTAETAAEAAQAAAEAAQAAAEAAAAGSLLKASNLSDVANAATAFANIKQAATESASGVLEIATQAETTTGTDDTRAITPKKLTEFAPATATFDTANDKILGVDATDSKIKQFAIPSVGPTNGTAVATTSGTAIQFTGIPSTVKRIIVSFAYVSTNGSSNLLLQIGPSGGVETSGYDSYTAVDIGTTNAKVNSTAGHVLQLSNAARQLTGQFILTLLDSSGNKWLISHFCQDHGSQAMQLGSSYKALSGTLERLRLTSVSGDTFDNGNMNIMYD